MISFVIAVAAIAAMALVMGAFSRVKEAEMENHWIKEYTESVGELCDSLEVQKESVRRYYHDLSKHIRTLEAMIERQKERERPDVEAQSADHEEMQSMEQMQSIAQTQSAASLEELKQFYESLHDAPREADICPDEVINAILLTKMQQCRDLQISFHICASVPEEGEITDAGMALEKPDWISDSDMAAILLNLLDNAIEAQTRIPSEEPRWIWLSMGIGDDASSGSLAPTGGSGSTEPSVLPGAVEAPGLPDSSGLAGVSESPDLPGSSGLPGAVEAPGLPDSSGLAGVSESPASSGLSVKSGSQGPSGASAPSGSLGISGMPGLSASAGSRELYIEVKNKIRADETISFQTRKPSPSEHGFGLRIIDSVIEKYHGSRKVQIDEEQHMFITRVTISGESL